MKTVLFSFHNSNFYSGASRSLLDILDRIIADTDITPIAVFPESKGSAIDYLKEKGVKVLTCPWRPLVQDEKQNIVVRVLKFPFFFYWYFKTVQNTQRLYEELKPYNISAVYSNTSINLTGALLQKMYGIPNIWHFREFRHEDHHIHYFLGDRLFMKFANKYSKRMIFISNDMYNFHLKLGGDKAKMERIYNDVSPRYIVEKDWQTFYSEEKINILIAGDVKEGKGQLDVLKSFVKIKDKYPFVNILLAGKFEDTAYTQTVSRFITDNKLNEQVKILGQVNDMNELREKCQVAIISSHKEAFGRVTIEGMLAGLLIVGRNAGGTKELVNHAQTGFLYEGEDENALARMLDDLLQDRNIMKSVASRAQREAIETYTKGNCCNRIVEFLNT